MRITWTLHRSTAVTQTVHHCSGHTRTHTRTQSFVYAAEWTVGPQKAFTAPCFLEGFGSEELVETEQDEAPPPRKPLWF